MITDLIPNDWRALQDAVAQILKECGFDVDVETTIQLVRGQAEVDVLGIETVNGREYKILCECKNWKRSVHQNVIHGFRTVVNDSGANKGYIISSRGFQSGSFTAAELTNVRLLTWEEFQQEYEPQWIERYLQPKIEFALDLVFDAVLFPRDAIMAGQYEEMNSEERAYFDDLVEQHNDFGALMHALTSRTPLELPIRGRYHWSKNGVPAAVLDAVTYRELLDAAVAHGKEASASFRYVIDFGVP